MKIYEKYGMKFVETGERRLPKTGEYYWGENVLEVLEGPALRQDTKRNILIQVYQKEDKYLIETGEYRTPKSGEYYFSENLLPNIILQSDYPPSEKRKILIPIYNWNEIVLVSSGERRNIKPGEFFMTEGLQFDIIMKRNGPESTVIREIFIPLSQYLEKKHQTPPLKQSWFGDDFKDIVKSQFKTDFEVLKEAFEKVGIEFSYNTFTNPGFIHIAGGIDQFKFDYEGRFLRID